MKSLLIIMAFMLTCGKPSPTINNELFINNDFANGFTGWERGRPAYPITSTDTIEKDSTGSFWIYRTGSTSDPRWIINTFKMQSGVKYVLNVDAYTNNRVQLVVNRIFKDSIVKQVFVGNDGGMVIDTFVCTGTGNRIMIQAAMGINGPGILKVTNTSLKEI